MIAIYKNIHEATQANTNQSMYFEPTKLPKPTTARPGSWEKVKAMRQRIDRGQILHHPDDETELATIEQQRELSAIMYEMKVKQRPKVAP